MSKLLTTITLLLISMLSYAEPHEVIIMTFNVENLFDYIHDEGKNDETYLPIEACFTLRCLSAVSLKEGRCNIVF